MKSEFVSGKFVVQRTVEEKTPFMQRLARIEGQVRGLRQMIDDNRYCGDALQQSSAITAAIREVTLMLISQQVHAHLDAMGTQGKEAERNEPLPGMEDFIEMLRSTYRLQ